MLRHLQIENVNAMIYAIMKQIEGDQNDVLFNLGYF